MIVRSTRADHYLVIANSTIRDRSLSWRARGLLAYLLSMPDGWQTNSRHLSTQAKEGRDAVRAALAELERAGYLRREQHQDAETGRWSTRTTVFDVATLPPITPLKKGTDRAIVSARSSLESDNHSICTLVEQSVDRTVDKSNTEAGFPGAGKPGALCITQEERPVAERGALVTVLERSKPSVCARCHGQRWVLTAAGDNTKRCPSCSTTETQVAP
tara:strand:- start:145 stop:792 length:648 start_codon:yes stop_codon:yes gene_type:complete